MLKNSALVMLFAAVSNPGVTLESIGEPGWSGFVSVGAGTGSVESNFLARLTGVDVDLSSPRINEFGEPDDEDITLPAFALNVGYTFENGKTRVFVGNDIEDFLQFEPTTLLALRHDMDSLGRLQIAALATAGLQTEVYEDPYQLDVRRARTERQTFGGRFTWDKILGSNFELKASLRDRELDEERSGEGLGLSDAERALLDREGDLVKVELGYLANIDDGKHILRPSIAYIDRDLDGDAMAQDGYEVALSYLYSATSGRLRWATNVGYSSLDGDAVNPVFGDVNDSDRVYLTSQLFFPKAFGWKHWMPTLTVAYGEDDSDIDFNDLNVWMVNASLFRRF